MSVEYQNPNPANKPTRKLNFDGMTRDEVIEMKMDVEFAISDIKSQLTLNSAKYEETDPQYMQWLYSAQLAHRWRKRELNQIVKVLAGRLAKVPKRPPEKPTDIARLTRDKWQLNLKEHIINELKVLVDPAEFIKCVERARLKVEHAKETENIKLKFQSDAEPDNEPQPTSNKSEIGLIHP